MSTPAHPRPQKVTTACLFAGLSSLLLLFSIGTSLSNWGSLALTESITEALAEPPLAGAGLEVGEVMGWLRIVLMGAAALAATGVIFSIYAARGHQPSRVILTVMAGFASLLFIATGVWGVLPAAFSIGCAFYLWSAEARAWFAVKNDKPVPSQVAAKLEAARERARPSDPPQTTEAASTLPVDGGGPATATASPPSGTQATQARPGSVTAAGIIALVASGIVGLFGGLMLVAYLASPSELARLIEENPMQQSQDLLAGVSMTAEELARWLFIGSLTASILSAVAFIAALLVLLGHTLGRPLLLGMSIVTVPLGIIALPVGLVWSGAAVGVIYYLSRTDAKAWFRSRS